MRIHREAVLMFKPIQIIYPVGSNVVHEAPMAIRERSRYLLPEAEQLLQRWEMGYVWEQWYDSPDSFMELIQVHAKADLLLPFLTTCHDLYSFHLLSGPTLRLVRLEEQIPSGSMFLHAGQYRLSYLPADTYQAHFSRGEYLIFYFVVKDQLLFREHSPEFHAPGAESVQALRDRLDIMQLSPARAIPLQAQQRIASYLRRPGITYLQRLENLQQLPIHLLRQYLQDLHLWQTATQDAFQLVKQVKALIQDAIADGAPVQTQRLAEQAGLTPKELNRAFTQQEGLSLNSYLIRQKLNYAAQLLAQKIPVEQVAHYLNWHPAHFRRIFKRHYGMSPSQYQDPY